MPAVLIDTDVAIDFLRGEAYAQPLISGLWRQGRTVLSVLTVYELTAGMREKERGHTLDFIGACNIEEVSKDIAVKAGDLYRQYRAKGITLTSLDCLIAATALVKGHKIVTRNVGHYPQEGLLLQLE
ncbi:MAG: type II toxin-antitoxin system VapC family toxin [Syntrophales bacterium]|nr:type II toxin-antitoxin system VapC family toxin [Syntrophales bacterium]